MSNSTIRFYDIPSNLGKCQAWSPNTWRIRLALNYKKIPYVTVWVEFPDIEKVCKEIGAAPTRMAGGKEHYTLPVIQDPSTGSTISNSYDIANYLDKQYPDAPELFPPGTIALQLGFDDAGRRALMAITSFSIPASHKLLNAASESHFRRTREAFYGKRLEDVPPVGEAREEAWSKVREGFDRIDEWLQEGGGSFVMGKTITYADLIVVASLLYLQRVFGEESAEWRDISRWNEGRWEGRLKALAEFQVEDK
ncbi:hypothetical protein HGRIS_006250 [Hohenbuehelia grisea]|uniref:GST N-terminal domain-containing protein n=1 Tax=Hohenbuehelia grisea TaxID=104357 RepID=A0ABR3K0Z2_9AGAR